MNIKQSVANRILILLITAILVLANLPSKVSAQTLGWSALGIGTDDNINALAVGPDGSLYAGGAFTTAGGVSANYIAKWDGTSWSALGSGMNGQVQRLVFDDDGNLYAAGWFTEADSVLTLHVAKWNGSTWSSVGIDNIWESCDYISALAFHDDKLYAGGMNDTGFPIIAEYDGIWDQLGGGFLDGRPLNFAFDDNDSLYVAGELLYGFTDRVLIGKWDGNTWNPILYNENDYVYDILFHQGDLYAVGDFTTIDGVDANNVAKFDGSTWSALGTGITGTTVDVTTIEIGTDGDLYIGGQFENAGGMEANNIAIWDGSSWSTLGEGTNSSISSFGFTYDTIYIGGSFTTAGGNSANYAARYAFDADGPQISTSSPASSATVEPGLTSISVQFNEDVLHDGSAGAANNTENYLLVEANGDGFQTITCAAGVSAQDTHIPINSASYSNNSSAGPFAAQLGVSPLTNGSYRLFVCGSTSIKDLAGNKLYDGEDKVISFTVSEEATTETTEAAEELPATGFPRGVVTQLASQPADLTYSATELTLEIPSLGIETAIVGVPLDDGAWDISWLGKNAGYLAGSAFPTWSGNTVLTGHVWDAFNQPGVFNDLKKLKYGDQILIHFGEQTYTYEVREKSLVFPGNVDAVMEHKDLDWVTLLTCEFYNPLSGNYIFRRAVQAVLVSWE